MKTITLSALLAIATLGGTVQAAQLAPSVVSKQSFQIPPLSMAIVKGDIQAVKAFITYGVDVNERNDQGVTPLMLAVRYNRVEIVKMLLEHGADKNAKDDSGVSVHDYAERSQAKESLALLDA